MLPPSEVRTPRLVTSVMSGAVTWMTSVPPAADGQLDDLGDHRLAVDARVEDRERPVHLEPELSHRPEGVLGLHLGHRDPCGGALGRIIQHSPAAHGTLRGGKRRDLFVHRGQGVHFAPHGLGFPGNEALRGGRFGGAGLPGDGAAGCALAAPGVLPRLLVQQPQRAPGQRLAVHRLVLPCEPVQLAGDRDRTGAEQVHDLLADAADLGAVAIGPGHHGITQRGQLGFQDPVGDRCDGEPLVVQAAGVQGPPLLVGAVSALDAVPDRDVHVELRVAVAGQMMQEQAGHQASTVTPLPRAGRMVPGAGVGGVPLQPGDGLAGGVHQRGLDLVGARVERGGLVLVAALAGLAGRDPVGGVQDRDALDGADSQVEVGHLVRVLASLGCADLGHLGHAGIRVRGQVRRHRRLFAFGGRLGLAAGDQQFPAGPDVVLVQTPDHIGVHLAAQPERGSALPGPLLGRLSLSGVVRHGADAAAAALAGGEVGHVVTRMEGDVSRHGPQPSPRSSL